MQNQISQNGAFRTSKVLAYKGVLRKIANTLTLFRATAGLPILIALDYKIYSLAWILVLVGAISDFADGALARRAGGGTKWGARLDPLADKILLLAPLIWLVSNSVLPIWSVWLLLTRELIISLWRSSELQGGTASKGGKAKTIFQFISVLLMIWPDDWGGKDFVLAVHKCGWYLFWPSLLLALFSAFNYLNPQSGSDRI